MILAPLQAIIAGSGLVHEFKSTMVITMKKILTAFLLSLSLSLQANEIDTWSSPPETISSTGVDSSNPHILLDGSANAVAIWLEGTDLVAKTKPLSMSWSSATTLSSSAASEPQLVVDSAGNATAIWVESGAIKTKTKPAGMSWGSVTTLASSGASAPQIAIETTTGDIVAVWLAGDGVESKTKPSGMSWSVSADTLSDSDSAAPQIALTSDGMEVNVVAVWHTLNSMTSLYNVKSATKTISGGTWSAPSTVSNTSLNSVFPKVAVDRKGNAAAIWFTYNYDMALNAYSDVILQSSYLPSGDLWSTPVDISFTGLRNPADFVSTIKFDSEGKAVALWTNSTDGANFSLETAQTDENRNWIDWTSLNMSLYTYSVDCALNAINDAFASYMTQDDKGSLVINTVEARISGINAGFWTNPVTISAGSENAFPQISAVITGGTNCHAAAAWVSNDGMVNVIQSSFGTGTAVSPPSNLAVDQMANNFDVFTEYFNILSWDASTDPDLNGYSIYRNNILIAFVHESTMPLQYIDNNREQNGIVTYGVSATDTSGIESAVISVTFP